MVYLIILGELLFLFLISRQLSQQLSRVIYTISKSERLTVYITALFFFPGVVVHEVSHWLLAQVLFVPTGKMEFMPVLRGSELKLGSVAIAQTDPIRRALIGVAPFLIGTVIILSALFSYQQLGLLPSQIKAIVVGYIIFEIGNTMFSSRKDLEGTFEVVLALVLVGIALYFLGVRFPEAWIYFFQTDEIQSLAHQAGNFLLIPIGLDLVFIVFLTIMLRALR